MSAKDQVPPQLGSSHPEPSKPHRILACVLCQQRKIKCDRRIPCGQCVKARAQCVPGSLVAKARRKRFAERDLLDRLRHYEALLRENNVTFQPLHPDHPVEDGDTIVPKALASRAASEDGDVAEDGTSASGADQNIKTEGVTPTYNAKSFWSLINSKPGDPDQETDSASDEESTVKMAWLKMFDSNEHILFGTKLITNDLSSLHPKQMEIFKLWQIYLDNVDPMIKVTHSTSLQTRIINAALDLQKVEPPLEALMFSIYCMALSSLADGQDKQILGSTKDELLRNYQFGCQQALLKCEFLRTTDRECLTALFLYLLSARPYTDPRSLSPMLGIAVRIAQRMNLHIEARNTTFPPFEAEMRRRLWWALVFIDGRVAAQGEQKSDPLLPIWDCAVPCNVNDFDLDISMKHRPTAKAPVTEAMFPVVRSRILNTMRTLDCWLDFTVPTLKLLAKAMEKPGRPRSDIQEIHGLTLGMEEVYLQHCDPDNALQFFTLWSARIFLVRARLLHYFANTSHAPDSQSDSQRNQGMGFAMSMLECDTKLASNPAVRKYRWFNNLFYPFPAYFTLIQDMKTRPRGSQVSKAWQMMSENYQVRFCDGSDVQEIFHKVLPKHILAAWRICERSAEEAGTQLAMPEIIKDLKRRRDGHTPNSESSTSNTDSNFEDFDLNRFFVPQDLGLAIPNFDNLDFDSMDFTTDLGGDAADWSNLTWT
ncbi:Fungal specific transcription factor domain-containing protein 23 [Elsinoe fawcettii]|nr:Fungal specific transcription factor domain-containing protein 23 [Elsinoe fawcettii]